MEAANGGGRGGQRSKGGGIVGRKMQTTDAREEFLARKDFRPESFRSFELSSFPLTLCEQRVLPATATDEISSELRYHEGVRRGILNDLPPPLYPFPACVPHTCKRNGHVQRGATKTGTYVTSESSSSARF